MVLAEFATVCPLLMGGGRSLNPSTLVGGYECLKLGTTICQKEGYRLNVKLNGVGFS